MSAQNLVDALARREPSTLEQLRQQFPGDDLLRRGRTLGVAPEPGTRADGAAVLAVLQRSLPALRADCDAILSNLGRRLRVAGQLRTASAVIAAVTSAGLLPALQVGERLLQLILAVITLAATLLSLLADRLTSGEAKTDIRGLFEQISDLSSRLLALERKLLTLPEVPVPGACDGLTAEADQIAYDLHRLGNLLKAF